jgi:hypothetical protein
MSTRYVFLGLLSLYKEKLAEAINLRSVIYISSQLETRASPSWSRYLRFSPCLTAPVPQSVIVDPWLLAATSQVGAEPVTAAGPEDM